MSVYVYSKRLEELCPCCVFSEGAAVSGEGECDMVSLEWVQFGDGDCLMLCAG